jgi:hypothetical protein
MTPAVLHTHLAARCVVSLEHFSLNGSCSYSVNHTADFATKHRINTCTAAAVCVGLLLGQQGAPGPMLPHGLLACAVFKVH